jgi:hypothetical protein
MVALLSVLLQRRPKLTRIGARTPAARRSASSHVVRDPKPPGRSVPLPVRAPEALIWTYPYISHLCFPVIS